MNEEQLRVIEAQTKALEYATREYGIVFDDGHVSYGDYAGQVRHAALVNIPALVAEVRRLRGVLEGVANCYGYSGWACHAGNAEDALGEPV